MKFIPVNVEESGLTSVISYIWEYRRKSFAKFSLVLQMYLLLSVTLISVKLAIGGFDGIGLFVLTFMMPVLFGYGILTVVYVILYVDVIRKEKEKRKEKLGRALSSNPKK
ncbi:hypothetical protein QTG56_22885 (plasmid) [Rossellomorea sp. AcN35-11]|nr:hypothetical protein [Rossellomorea aquimaris]WJV32214.1 hypothetical protein QTG56_22885 [Rossellomorea sp. AcN35-11]